MAYDFTSLFHPYQDNGRLIMKDCVQWNPPFTVGKISPQAGLETGTSYAEKGCKNESSSISSERVPIQLKCHNLMKYHLTGT